MSALEQYFSPLSLARWADQALRIGIVLAAFIVSMIVVGALIRRFRKLLIKGIKDNEAKKRATTLTRIMSSLAYALLFFIAVMYVLSVLKIDIKPILAAAGIGGIALGFGAQSLVKDLIAGFFFLLENQVRVGDVVQVGDIGGVVEDIRLRVLMLRDLSGNLHIIPHGNISSVTNMTHTFSYSLFNYGVAYKEDVEKVIDVIKDVSDELMKDPAFRDDILEPVEILGLDKFGDSAVIIAGRIKTRPIKQWRVGRELNLRIKKRFDQLGIEIPFPQRTVHFANFPESLLKSLGSIKEAGNEKE